MSKKEWATVYFIRRESLLVEFITIMDYTLKKGHSYESEAINKTPEDAIHPEIIYSWEEGSANAIERKNRIYQLADKLRYEK